MTTTTPVNLHPFPHRVGAGVGAEEADPPEEAAGEAVEVHYLHLLLHQMAALATAPATAGRRRGPHHLLLNTTAEQPNQWDEMRIRPPVLPPAHRQRTPLLPSLTAMLPYSAFTYHLFLPAVEDHNDLFGGVARFFLNHSEVGEEQQQEEVEPEQQQEEGMSRIVQHKEERELMQGTTNRESMMQRDQGAQEEKGGSLNDTLRRRKARSRLPEEEEEEEEGKTEVIPVTDREGSDGSKRKRRKEKE